MVSFGTSTAVVYLQISCRLLLAALGCVSWLMDDRDHYWDLHVTYCRLLLAALGRRELDDRDHYWD
jgi:hypothetical protein